ncbi:hypothetical protein [Azospirillum humicireducens]|uniref:hypothetical protein n=1 Tax=Azospirillum humicireducens TaxID=1226968 RepID=UPI00157F7F47|nr:hypothetical protein [Azospirillum humicireducens]
MPAGIEAKLLLARQDGEPVGLTPAAERAARRVAARTGHTLQLRIADSAQWEDLAPVDARQDATGWIGATFCRSPGAGAHGVDWNFADSRCVRMGRAGTSFPRVINMTVP